MVGLVIPGEEAAKGLGETKVKRFSHALGESVRSPSNLFSKYQYQFEAFLVNDGFPY